VKRREEGWEEERSDRKSNVGDMGDERIQRDIIILIHCHSGVAKTRPRRHNMHEKNCV
jgi:hypothetical protein